MNKENNEKLMIFDVGIPTSVYPYSITTQDF